VPGPAAFPAAGSPIAPSQLTLKAGGVGPLRLGDPITEVAGRLTASLGTADATGAVTDELCAGDEGIWIRWGALQALFRGDATTGTFAGYRYALTADMDPAVAILRTPSGLRLGDSVADLERIYTRFGITYTTDATGANVFRLLDGETLLLWGPISSPEPDGTVEGIYSPVTCPAG